MQPYRMPHRLTMLATALSLAIASVPASGQETATDRPFALKLAHWLPAAHPLHHSIDDWASSLTKTSNGTITVRIFPERQLGKAFDHYDLARTGMADLALANPGLQIGRFPVIEALDLPLLISDGIGGSVALDAWYRNHAAREMKDVVFCLALVHEPGTLHSVNNAVTEPGDIKGMKVVPAQHTLGAFIKSAGGRIVRVADGDLRDAMVRSVARAATLPWHTAIVADTHEISRHHLDLPLYTTALALVINRDSYARLSPQQKAAVDAHCNNTRVGRIATPWATWERAGKTRMASLKRHEVHVPAPDQLAQWRKAAEPLTAKWAQRVKRAEGGDPDTIFKALQAELTKHRAAF